MLGTDNLKKGLKLAFDFAEQTAVIAEGGIKWYELASYFDELLLLPGVIKDGKLILEEIKDLDPAEANELGAWAAAEFDIPNDSVEESIEQGLGMIANLWALYNTFKTIRAKRK